MKKSTCFISFVLLITSFVTAQTNLAVDTSFESGVLKVGKTSEEKTLAWYYFSKSDNSISVSQEKSYEGSRSLLIKSNSDNTKRYQTCIAQSIGVQQSSKVKITFYAQANQDAQVITFITGYNKVLTGDKDILLSTMGRSTTIYKSSKFQKYTIILNEVAGSGKRPIDFSKPLEIRIGLMGNYTTAPLELYIDDVFVVHNGK